MFGAIVADRSRDPLIAQYDFRDPRRNHADAVLAGTDALDDGYIGVSDLVLDVAAKFVKIVAGLLGKQRPDRHASDMSRRPYEHFGRTVFSQYLRTDRACADAEPASQVKSKAQTVQICAGAQDPTMTHHARRVCQRIWRIGDDQHQCLRLNGMKP